LDTELVKQTRRNYLDRLGGDRESIESLLSYTENHFPIEAVPPSPVLPMKDEGHLQTWRAYAEEQGASPFEFLRQRLVQLNFPIREGISGSQAYAEAIRQGKSFNEETSGKRLELESPALFRIRIHENQAGALPVLFTSHRPDFIAIVQALAFQSEPHPINPSVNAQMVSGLLNRDRVNRYKAHWMAGHGAMAGPVNWYREMQRVQSEEPWRFFDRLIIVCEHPYSSVSAADLGLDMDEQSWIDRSTVLRLEHEFTHYATKRLYASMNTNLFDEIICDWAGVSAALGDFQSKWPLRFFGLENWPEIRPSGRAGSYRANLDDRSFALLCALAVQACAGLEELHRSWYKPDERSRFLLALSRLTLELIACDEREVFFREAYRMAGKLLGVPRSSSHDH
jgi:hypothetical protein